MGTFLLLESKALWFLPISWGWFVAYIVFAVIALGIAGWAFEEVFDFIGGLMALVFVGLVIAVIWSFIVLMWGGDTDSTANTVIEAKALWFLPITWGWFIAYIVGALIGGFAAYWLIEEEYEEGWGGFVGIIAAFLIIAAIWSLIVLIGTIGEQDQILGFLPVTWGWFAGYVIFTILAFFFAVGSFDEDAIFLGLIVAVATIIFFVASIGSLAKLLVPDDYEVIDDPPITECQEGYILIDGECELQGVLTTNVTFLSEDYDGTVVLRDSIYIGGIFYNSTNELTEAFDLIVENDDYQVTITKNNVQINYVEGMTIKDGTYRITISNPLESETVTYNIYSDTEAPEIVIQGEVVNENYYCSIDSINVSDEVGSVVRYEVDGELQLPGTTQYPLGRHTIVAEDDIGNVNETVFYISNCGEVETQNNTWIFAIVLVVAVGIIGIFERRILS